MSAMTTVVAIAVAVIVILAIGFVVLQQQQRRRQLRRRFGPEYDRTMDERDTRGQAEQELRDRQQRVSTLDIKPLTPESRQAYIAHWVTLQEQFVDTPARAVRETDQLVTAAMAERGYPTEDFDQQLADLSVVHGRTLHHYRQAREISVRAALDAASTEDLRQAMVHYRVLFEELLNDGDEHHPPSAEGREEQSASQDDSRQR
ncbi:hypothetical protein ACTMTF_25230 [Nonomuraea sp. ZG12]|uniref:hypothetical protein n=1 Tax=Nonomuraea sp. ZG12 TaxID=3452207 RepID=UPI003F8A5DC3